MDSTRRIQTLLLAVGGVLVLVIAFYMGLHFGKQQASSSSAGTDSSNSASDNKDAKKDAKTETKGDGKPVANADLVPGRDYAPSHTDPKILELVRAEVHRKADDPRAIGDPNAPVVLVSYEDFACPMCGVYHSNTHEKLLKLVDEGKLRIEFRDLVIFPNYNSQLAHQGARAAGQQGKFWEFTKEAFALTANGAHPQYTKELILDLAKRAGVENLSAFEKAFESEEIVNGVQEETLHARQNLGLTGTPFFIVGDAVVSGAQPTEYFFNTIEQQLIEAK
ncbi:DsbA family protein [Gleimia sp. 6138-11-ORH1]|uniref:DsbA family protein n=1 Tax=Gleimia sp. 6138-11-ORH1 TaxID=2973937 RepID=UPI002169F7B3|nr:DsbA family protein [Gleimia sp. 6138-11-ORH1]MCS4485038.1 DsbA family protein [Gleimia sp. 6138-11-ORH1]